MCGIAAILKFQDTSCPPEVLDRMRDEVAHRGPNDHGRQFFRQCEPAAGQTVTAHSGWDAGLAHRRLSILDLSPAGHQPMVYRDNFWIIYNGEVYNFVEVRSQLERLGHVFHSSSDTEVILGAYAEWGTACFTRFRGMWGLVILDGRRREVILCRDRLGIKPLYLWKGNGIVAVASEIKQFRHLPGFTPRLHAGAATEFLETGYEDPDRSFFQGVQPIKAGSWLRIPLDTLVPSIPEEYWHPETVAVSVTDAEEAGRVFADKLRECVRIHLRSDVPVGCALSGGLDSSSIAVLAHALRNGHGEAFHTFTLTFPGDATDERAYADAVVAQIHALPHRVTLEPGVFLEDLDKFVWTHDEPVGSLSMYAAFCVARLTRDAGVPVTLNGQGGDEVLSGYWQSYFMHLRDLLKQGRLLSLAGHFMGPYVGNGNPTLLGQIPVMLRRYTARRRPPIAIDLGASESLRPPLLKRILDLDDQSRRIFEMRAVFLPRLLKWDDRNFMAFSVESRYPFLDHELIELCLSFAPRILYQGGWTKYPLRLGLKSQLPPKVRDRRSKFGFETPQDKWLCGPLRPTLERWLESDRPVWDYIDRVNVRRLAEQTWQVAGRQDEFGQALFRIFIFDRWLSVCGVQV